MTTTGAGDRFTAALAAALTREWECEPALALGNACAAHYVATAETATRADVASLVQG